MIGNGHIATNVLSDTVYMNGLYNGEEDKSSRARIPNYIAVDVMKDNDTSRKYELDMYKGESTIQVLKCIMLAYCVTICILLNQVIDNRRALYPHIIPF